MEVADIETKNIVFSNYTMNIGTPRQQQTDRHIRIQAIKHMEEHTSDSDNDFKREEEGVCLPLHHCVCVCVCELIDVKCCPPDVLSKDTSNVCTAALQVKIW